MYGPDTTVFITHILMPYAIHFDTSKIRGETICVRAAHSHSLILLTCAFHTEQERREKK